MYVNRTSSQTHNGRVFDFAAPEPGMIGLDDIGQTLFRLPRFNGHILRDPDWGEWTVGHHSMLVAALIAQAGDGDPSIQAAALLHDASEAYTGDCPGPFKRLIGEAYKQLERGIEAAIAERFGVPYPWPPCIKQADLLSQDIEAAMLIPGGPMPGNLVREGFRLNNCHRELLAGIWPQGEPEFRGLVLDACERMAPATGALAR